MKSLLATLSTLLLVATLIVLQGCGNSGCDGYVPDKTTTTYLLATDSASPFLRVSYLESETVLTPYKYDSSSYCAFAVSSTRDSTKLIIETPGNIDTLCFTTKLYGNIMANSECYSDEFTVNRSSPAVAFHTLNNITYSQYSHNNYIYPYRYDYTVVYRVWP